MDLIAHCPRRLFVQISRQFERQKWTSGFSFRPLTAGPSMGAAVSRPHIISIKDTFPRHDATLLTARK